jgi:hypothetical protein
MTPKTAEVMPSEAKFSGLEDASKLDNPRISRMLQKSPWMVEEIQAMYPDFELNKRSKRTGLKRTQFFFPFCSS